VDRHAHDGGDLETEREFPMANAVDVRWGRWAALAGGMVMFYGAVRCATGVVRMASREALYRAHSAGEWPKRMR
jgi:hypothetical protein